MSLLDSLPLEPLTFNFVSFGFFALVHNLWTWLAAATAAVGFWKIRAGAGSPSSICLDSDSRVSPPCNHETSSGSPPAAAAEVVESSPTTSSSVAAAAPSSAPSLAPEDDDGVATKGVKFAVYYESDDGELTVAEENDGEEEEEEAAAEAEIVVVEEYSREWWESWERMLKMRSGEMSWYRYQDMTEINGNVVKLWDGCTSTRTRQGYTYRDYSCDVW